MRKKQGNRQMTDSHVTQLMKMARMYRKRLRFEEAKKLYAEIFKVQNETHNFDTSETALALYDMGELCCEKGLPDASVTYFKLAVRVWSTLAEFEPVPLDLFDKAERLLRDQARLFISDTMQSLTEHENRERPTHR